MLCGCANPVVEPRSPSTAPSQLRHGFTEGRRLIVPSSPMSLRHCFAARVQPSPVTDPPARGPAAESEESLGLGAEAAAARSRVRSYTLTDGATSAIGRILTCFQDTESNSDDLTRSRPRSRSLWSRRRSPASCIPASSPGTGTGCMVDVVLDCSPGTVRRRRLETQSVASTSSTLHSDAAWNPTSPNSEASCELTGTSSEVLVDHPVWERRQIHRGRRRLTVPVRQSSRPAVSEAHGGTTSDIPPTRDSRDNSTTRHDRSKPGATPNTAATSRRRVTRRAVTCAIPHPQVRVVQTTSNGAGGAGHGRPVKTGKEHLHNDKPTTPCPVSRWLELFISCSSSL